MKGTRVDGGKGCSILLVDDEREYVAVLSKRLRKRGFSVTTAFTGSEGIQELRRTDFDVALVDLKMEDMDGLEVLNIFKKMVPELEVIMLTGHGSAHAAKEGIKKGAFDYLSKPCDIEDLIVKIEQALRKSESRESEA
ncbi:MAG: response regulator [Desulfomonilaceae bacterium]|nr:response regulator [Desulfomonilaceae bacterium]